MQTFNLTIKLGNDAMQAPEHIVGALNSIIYDGVSVEPESFGSIFDTNGNRVGEWSVS